LCAASKSEKVPKGRRLVPSLHTRATPTVGDGGGVSGARSHRRRVFCRDLHAANRSRANIVSMHRTKPETGHFLRCGGVALGGYSSKLTCSLLAANSTVIRPLVYPLTPRAHCRTAGRKQCQAHCHWNGGDP
jgi:hypothetical protein